MFKQSRIAMASGAPFCLTESLTGRVAVVTGASSGIGKAIATHLSRHGASVVLAARSADKLASLCEELSVGDAKVLAVPTDVSSMDDVKVLAERTFEHFGARVDILVNCAGTLTVLTPHNL